MRLMMMNHADAAADVEDAQDAGQHWEKKKQFGI